MAESNNTYSENGPRLATFKRSETEEQRINLSSFEGHLYVQLSTWRKDEEGKLRVVKTQSIRRREVGEFIAALTRAQEMMDDETASGSTG